MISEDKKRISIYVTIMDVTGDLVSMVAAGITVLNGTADVDAATITTTTTLYCVKQNV